MTFPAKLASTWVWPSTVDEEARQLEASRCQCFRALGVVGIVAKKLRIMPSQHACAGARRGDHVIKALEGVDHATGDQDGIRPVSGIISRLPATGLGERNLDPRAARLQKLDRGEADAWPEQVDEAGHKQSDQRTLLCIGRGQSHISVQSGPASCGGRWE